MHILHVTKHIDTIPCIYRTLRHIAQLCYTYTVPDNTSLYFTTQLQYLTAPYRTIHILYSTSLDQTPHIQYVTAPNSTIHILHITERHSTPPHIYFTTLNRTAPCIYVTGRYVAIPAYTLPRNYNT